MRRRALALLLAGCTASALGLVATAALDERELAFTLGVRATKAAVVIPPGGTGCQRWIPVSSSFASVELMLGTYFRPGPPVEVSMLDRRMQEQLGSATLAGGYEDNARHRLRVGEVEAGSRIAVCVRNRGERKLAVYGGESDFSLTSDAIVDGEPSNGDMDLVFIRAEPTSMFALIPDAFERAALWHPASVTILWLLATLMLLAVLALLARALASARD